MCKNAVARCTDIMVAQMFGGVLYDFLSISIGSCCVKIKTNCINNF